MRTTIRLAGGLVADPGGEDARRPQRTLSALVGREVERGDGLQDRHFGLDNPKTGRHRVWTYAVESPERNFLSLADQAAPVTDAIAGIARRTTKVLMASGAYVLAAHAHYVPLPVRDEIDAAGTVSEGYVSRVQVTHR